MTKLYFYRCINRRCRQYGKEYSTAMGPADFRRATGQSPSCADCGGIQAILRIERVRPDSELAKALTEAR